MGTASHQFQESDLRLSKFHLISTVQELVPKIQFLGGRKKPQNYSSWSEEFVLCRNGKLSSDLYPGLKEEFLDALNSEVSNISLFRKFEGR